jgi:hypothetical protein
MATVTKSRFRSSLAQWPKFGRLYCVGILKDGKPAEILGDVVTRTRALHIAKLFNVPPPDPDHVAIVRPVEAKVLGELPKAGRKGGAN